MSIYKKIKLSMRLLMYTDPNLPCTDLAILFRVILTSSQAAEIPALSLKKVEVSNKCHQLNHLSFVNINKLNFCTRYLFSLLSTPGTYDCATFFQFAA